MTGDGNMRLFLSQVWFANSEVVTGHLSPTVQCVVTPLPLVQSVVTPLPPSTVSTTATGELDLSPGLVE
jgi:hypothetical protein